MIKYLLLIVTLFALYSCNNEEYNVDASGMKYRFFEENTDNKKPVPGDILVLYMSYSTDYDSLLFDTKEMHGQPFRMRMNDAATSGGTIDNAFAMMHEGDSACFIVDAEKFFLISKGTGVPDFVKKGSLLKFNIRLVEIFAFDKYNEAKKNSAVLNEESEQNMLDLYLQNANITQEPLNSGLYFIEHSAGTGTLPQKGQKITLHYTGSFLSGEVFDSSLERGEPFTFEFGANEVIPGMEEGISKMKKGTKATLIIPSYLAYGKEQYKMIPPFSTLIFEIEILNIN